MCLGRVCACISAKDELGEIALITGDGSIDCNDNPAEQEAMTAQLHFCELVCALGTCVAIDGGVVTGLGVFEVEPRHCAVYFMD